MYREEDKPGSGFCDFRYLSLPSPDDGLLKARRVRAEAYVRIRQKQESDIMPCSYLVLPLSNRLQ